MKETAQNKLVLPEHILALPAGVLSHYRELAPALLAWYGQHARVLPWRQSPSPYRVWISEIMLQQTRVEAALDYFIRFVGELPDASALAAVPEQQLLKLWEGLGYYSRARNLQKAAQLLVKEYGGNLPADYDALLTLPGIGPYTAGAIASIAFGIAAPAVDGNVLRVFSRLTGSEADIAAPRTKDAVHRLLAVLMPTQHPGDFNQALMELGATVCIPVGAPRCGQCPVSSMCTAYLEGTTSVLPVKSSKKARRIENRTILVLQHGEHFLLRKRSSKGLLSGLWEFPGVEGHLHEEELKDACLGLGLSVVGATPLGASKHIFSHVEWHMVGWNVQVSQPAALPDCVWVSQEEMQEKYPLPSALRHYFPFEP